MTTQPPVPAQDRYLAATHEVTNMPPRLEAYNLYQQDQALKEAVHREGGGWAEAELNEYGKLVGRPEIIELGFQANEHKPVLHTHDRHGHRVDLVSFHPAYHQLMNLAIEHGLHSSPWTIRKPAPRWCGPPNIICTPKSKLATAAPSP